jgi:hypothetical protein
MYEALLAGTVTIEDLRKAPATDASVLDLAEAKLLEAEAVIVLAQQALGVDHPAWSILDGYDGSMDSLKELVAQSAEYRSEMERYQQEALDSGRVVGGILRVLRDNGLGMSLADPEPPGEMWKLAQRVIELEGELKERDAEIRTMEQERRWKGR